MKAIGSANKIKAFLYCFKSFLDKGSATLSCEVLRRGVARLGTLQGTHPHEKSAFDSIPLCSLSAQEHFLNYFGLFHFF